MKGPGVPVSDSHMHVNPVKGMGAEKVVKKFKAEGGWFASLIMLPSWDYGAMATSWEEYQKYVRLHIMECKRALSEGITVACFAGFHPAEINRLLDKGMEPRRVFEYGVTVLKGLFKMCENGELDGVGELGRQHYKTTVPPIIIAEKLLQYSMDLSKDSGCRMQFHLENVKGFTAWEISGKVESHGIKDRIIVHHARSNIIDEVLDRRLWATTPGILGNLQAVFKKAPQTDTLLVESDFIDDPKRPGVVVEPWKIGANFKTLLSESIIDEEKAHKVMVDNVVKFFGVEPP